jgi:hypothetical protein
MKKDTTNWTCKHCGKPIMFNPKLGDWRHSRHGLYGCKNEASTEILPEINEFEAEPDLFKYYYEQI